MASLALCLTQSASVITGVPICPHQHENAISGGGGLTRPWLWRNSNMNLVKKFGSNILEWMGHIPPKFHDFSSRISWFAHRRFLPTVRTPTRRCGKKWEEILLPESEQWYPMDRDSRAQRTGIPDSGLDWLGPTSRQPRHGTWTAAPSFSSSFPGSTVVPRPHLHRTVASPSSVHRRVEAADHLTNTRATAVSRV